MQSATLRAEQGKRTRPGIAKQEAGVQVDGGRWNLIGKVRRHVGIQTEDENGNPESEVSAVENPTGIPVVLPLLRAA